VNLETPRSWCGWERYFCRYFPGADLGCTGCGTSVGVAARVTIHLYLERVRDKFFEKLLKVDWGALGCGLGELTNGCGS